MKIEIRYSKHIDLVFHILAHMKVNNASDLYCDEYIEKLAKEKQNFQYDIIPHINSIQDYYNNNFGRLNLINFLPFFTNDFNELKNIFKNYEYFTCDDINCFINPFIEIMDYESTFFFDYWEKIHKQYENDRNKIENKFKSELDKYSCVFEYYNKTPLIFFSYNMTKNGRGLTMDSFFAAGISFPQDENNIHYHFIQLLHEYTHQFTDKLLERNINMDDGSHFLSELVVILTDYYLIKKIDNGLIPKYLQMFGFDENIDEDKLLKHMNIDEKTINRLRNEIDNILLRTNERAHCI
jgi:hypothetical protein